MKNIILTVLVSLLFLIVIGCGNKDTVDDANASEEDESIELINDAYSMINKSSNYAIDLSRTILTVWDESVDKGFNFNSVFVYMFSGDISDHGWSGLGMDDKGFSTFSWGNIANKMNSFASDLMVLEQNKVEIDNMLVEVKNIEDERYQSQKDSLINYYITYTKIYNAAVSPTGNKLGYSSNLTDLLNEYEGSKIEIEMKLN